MAPAMNPGRQTGSEKRQAQMLVRALTVPGPTASWRYSFAEGRTMGRGLADWSWRCAVCHEWSDFGGLSCPHCEASFRDFPPVVVRHKAARCL